VTGAPTDDDYPTRHGTRLTFHVETFDEWSARGVEAIANEFQRMFGGNLSIRSAWLDRAEPYTYTDDD